ncbi:type II toxin-antitoxin system HipA family toxin [Zoogloea sp. LCSB751]|uniref:type II toxin-antitoxin system HipA family toxin n=1 Tax=Zoogloea sp. LCSB751 TaxID=1965277 RepID=UPI0009A4F020|nr:type II toxin-antitoxin system HipA family toxin [Zoogloea sp. LCSB751]
MARVPLEVWLDAPELHHGLVRVGMLYPHDARTDLPPSFAYDRGWLESPRKFELDPQLPLVVGGQHPSRTRWFGVFLDVAPDRWGRVLMERREGLAARDEGRTMQRLTDFDFMLGVSDITRTGALRFRLSAETPFMAPDELRSVPPVTSLRELAEAAASLEDPSAEERPEYRHWLSMLLAPGTSLGGARPKATFRETDGRLWLAKFPSHNDRRDWGAWEFITHTLARKAGINVPEAQLLRLGARYHTFCVERFDRLKSENPAIASRRMYASAMTLLARQDGEPDGSYLDVAQVLEDCGGVGLEDDLAQLFRRAAFNLVVGNRDDHLRNHGFLRTRSGWRLSPAFDMNPNPDKSEHALTWDGTRAAPDIDVLGATHELYRLTRDEAFGIVSEVVAAVTDWQALARRHGVASQEIQLMESVFQI